MVEKMGRVELFRNVRANLEWFGENYEVLRKKYDGCWIVVEGKKVVKSVSTFDEVLSFVGKHDSSKAIVEYMQSDPIAAFF
jgi:hypothetical protein